MLCWLLFRQQQSLAYAEQTTADNVVRLRNEMSQQTLKFVPSV
jgi:hypothetical protein